MLRRIIIISLILTFFFGFGSIIHAEEDQSSGEEASREEEFSALWGGDSAEIGELDPAPPTVEGIYVSDKTDSKQLQEELYFKIMRYTLSFLGIIAMIFIVIGGFYYITAHGDDSQIETGKNMVVYAILGILIIIGSYTMVATVLRVGRASQGDLVEYILDWLPG